MSKRPAYTALEVSVILAIVAVLAIGAGYYGRKDSLASAPAATASPSPSSTAASVATTTPASSSTPTAEAISSPASTAAQSDDSELISGWSTYADTADGFTLKYPPKMTINRNNFSLACDYAAGNRCAQFFIDMDEENASKGLEADISSYFSMQESGSQGKSKITDQQSVTYNNTTWQAVTFYAYNGGNTGNTANDLMHYELFTIHGSHLYQIDYSEQQKGVAEDPATFQFQDLQTLDDILSTWTFTK